MENLFCAIFALFLIYSLSWFLLFIIYEENHTKINNSKFYSVLIRIAVFVSPLAIVLFVLGVILVSLAKLFLMFLRWFFGCKK